MRDISSEASAWQTIQIKCLVSFSRKKKKKKKKKKKTIKKNTKKNNSPPPPHTHTHKKKKKKKKKKIQKTNKHMVCENNISMERTQEFS